MTTKLIATLTVLAALAVAPAAASAAEPARAPAQPTASADGIIAVLIGFTPPIGSNKGSFAGTGWGLDEMEKKS